MARLVGILDAEEEGYGCPSPNSKCSSSPPFHLLFIPIRITVSGGRLTD